ncbi:MAG: hypothetical protein IV090_06650 [Candidatus Sericytochromatia bacterium]|nr:hypothetical protein [Candidatus Sericytochromatia bacterium]
MAIDGNVSGLNQTTFRALQQIKDPKNMTEAEATQLKTAIAKDGIDSAEEDLIAELTRTDGKSITINAEKDAGFSPQSLQFNPVATKAQGVLNSLKPTVTEADLNKLWAKGAPGVRDIAKLFKNPANTNIITAFAMKRLAVDYAVSNPLNGYAPMIRSIRNFSDGFSQLSPEDKARGSQFIYNVVSEFDRTKAGGMIPDLLYERFKN